MFPHGVLFRQEEAEMRSKLIEADLIECVLGLGPNLFYNSPMEACVVVCRTAKPKVRKGKVIFINAVDAVIRERAQSFLTNDHIKQIVEAYLQFNGEPGFAKVASLEEIRGNDASLSIPLYVKPGNPANLDSGRQTAPELMKALSLWLQSSADVRRSLDTLVIDEEPKRKGHLWDK